MAKKTNPKDMVINLPGVNIPELLELEEFLPQLRMQLARVMYVAVVIAQIRMNLLRAKPREVEALESVNFYIRNGLSKSEPMLYVSAGVAIRKTTYAYLDDPDGDKLIEDHLDLMMNTTGKASTKGGIKVAMTSVPRLRENRRGLMLQTVGTVQAATIHSPMKFNRDVLAITPANFLKCLPFDTNDITLENITEYHFDSFEAKKSKDGRDVAFLDTLEFPDVPLEAPFRKFFIREFVKVPEISEEYKKQKLTKLQQLALKQIENLKEG